jgi:hypothetical protein
MGREATLYLLERGVRVTGTDAWSWDAPFAHTKEKFTKTGNAACFPVKIRGASAGWTRAVAILDS